MKITGPLWWTDSNDLNGRSMLLRKMLIFAIHTSNFYHMEAKKLCPFPHDSETGKMPLIQKQVFRNTKSCFPYTSHDDVAGKNT